MHLPDFLIFKIDQLAVGLNLVAEFLGSRQRFRNKFTYSA